MSSWPTGVEAVKQMLTNGNLQKVVPSREAATAFLDAAEKHLVSALAITESDPDGAYSLLYDAARKSLAALLQTQGLRATSPQTRPRTSSQTSRRSGRFTQWHDSSSPSCQYSPIDKPRLRARQALARPTTDHQWAAGPVCPSSCSASASTPGCTARPSPRRGYRTD